MTAWVSISGVTPIQIPVQEIIRGTKQVMAISLELLKVPGKPFNSHMSLGPWWWLSFLGWGSGTPKYTANWRRKIPIHTEYWMLVNWRLSHVMIFIQNGSWFNCKFSDKWRCLWGWEQQTSKCLNSTVHYTTWILLFITLLEKISDRKATDERHAWSLGCLYVNNTVPDHLAVCMWITHRLFGVVMKST